MNQVDQLREIVSRVFDVPPSGVTDDMSRERVEAWTSLNHLLLISEIEAEMRVEFTSDEVLRIKTYRDLREIVSSKQ